MRFFVFIEANQAEILDGWDDFAKTLFPAREWYLGRDHAALMLAEISADMRRDQTDQEEVDKSRGGVSPFHSEDSAANIHGTARSDDGLNVSQLVAEFRSLRALIMRLWLPQIDVFSHEVISDIIRFNESIDEAVADSITSHSANG